MKRSVTLKDLARATGVHVSTVSRALDPTGRTSLTEGVVKRVRDAAEEMGYRPNRLASGLRTNRSMTVGIMIPDITNSLFPPIMRGVDSVLEPLGYAPIIVNTDSIPEREDRLIEVLQERGVDGIIHAAVSRDDPKVAQIAERGLPVVTVNRKIENSGIPSVVSDDALGIRKMLRHLYDLGHRRIAHVAGPKDISTGQVRLAAFNEACRDLNLPQAHCPTIHSERYDEEEGHRCTDLLLQKNREFTAIHCANDRLSLGALDALRSHGFECPRDMSVTGFNDIPFLARIPPGLTTVHVQLFEMGQTSARILVQMMTDPEAQIPPETILPVHLVLRDSVAPVRQHAL